MLNPELDRRRWAILAASCIMNIFGGSFYAWSVFAGPLAARLSSLSGASLTASDLAGIFTLTTALFPLPMILGGWINDKLGPRWVVFGGGILFALAMTLSGHAAARGTLMLTYGVLMAIAAGVNYTCAVGNTLKFFPDHRGLASGLTTAFNGLGAVIFPLVASAMNVTAHVTRVMTVLGLSCGAIIILCSFFLQTCPPDYVPHGHVPPPPPGDGLSRDENWRQMLRDPMFYLMLVLLLCGAFMGLLTTSQAAPIAQEMAGMSAGAAAGAVSLLALCNALGRVTAGTISDRLGRENTLAAAYLLSIGGMCLLYFTGPGQTLRLCGSLCLIGFCFGSVMGIFPGFTADRFGAHHNSLNYSIMFLGYSLAGLTAPLLLGGIHRSTGRYQPAFLLAMGVSALGFLLILLHRILKLRQSKTG